jgi:HSP20 family protein
MVRWYYRSIFDELEDLREYIESLNRQIDAINRGALLPASGESAIMMLPSRQTPFPVDVSENDDEVVVIAVMAEGTMKKDISLDLINPLAVEITCEWMNEKTDENAGFFLQERMSGSVMRTVPLPKPVTDEGSSATFRDGRLLVRLKKITKKSEGKIFVD